ncbi:MAG: RNA polymerase sigma factor [Bacteroidota bacterium]
MNPPQIRNKLKALHPESLAWAQICCQGQSDLAQEVLQTCYLKVLEGQATFKGKSRFKTWFFAVIKNTSADLWKKEQTRQTRKQAFPPNLPNISEEEVTQESEYESPDLEKALAQLPEKQREILHLVFYQALTLDQAAEVMQVAKGTARQHYHRAKKKLKERLTNEPKKYG